MLWSSSWVLIVIGLEDIPALPFAGLRYTLAFLCLLPFALRSDLLSKLRRLSAGMWVRLPLLGLLFYTVTQGAQFLTWPTCRRRRPACCSALRRSSWRCWASSTWGSGRR